MKLDTFGDLLILSDHEGRILLQKNEQTQKYFLPGIKICAGISITEQLKKYLTSHCNTFPNHYDFVSVFEDVYPVKETIRHDLHFIFKIQDCMMAPDVPANLSQCHWKDISTLPRLGFEPSGLKKDLIEILKGREIYFTSNVEKV